VYFISPEIDTEEERIEKMELFRSLQRSLDSLPEKYRAVLTLRYFENLRYDEIAQILGLSERSARRLWSFARAWLYRHLRREHSGTTCGS